MEIKCENCGTLTPVSGCYQDPKNGEVYGKCKTGCKADFAAITAGAIETAKAEGLNTIPGLVLVGWRREKMLAERAKLKKTPAAEVEEKPQQAAEEPARLQQQAPPPPEPKQSAELQQSPDPGNNPVLADARRRAEAAGQAPHDPGTNNPVLADAMRRAKQ